MLPPFPGQNAFNPDAALACTFPPNKLISANAEFYVFQIFYLGSLTALGSPNQQKIIAPKGMCSSSNSLIR